MLTLAATREDRLVRPPELPAAAARQVIRSLLNNGLVEEVLAPTDGPAYIWRETEGGMTLVLRVTDQGLAAMRRRTHGSLSTKGIRSAARPGLSTVEGPARTATRPPLINRRTARPRCP